VIGTLHVTLAAVPHLAAAPDGSVVMINSQAARRSQARRGPYSASKAALLSAARTLAAELGRDGIRVNSVVPGQIWGPPLERFYEEVAARKGQTPEEVYRTAAKEMALGRIPTSDEVADAVVFFASPLSRSVTGQSLDVNGGNWFE
jgi:NAD(P)-dependent dehydrogenase (short-subunit alcohol dehydrogenase family)